MKCDMCDNEATVFLTQIVDGKMTQVNLCDKCSKEKGVTDPTGFQLADFLLGNAAQKKTRQSSAEDDTLACPECGFTRAHLKKIGRMGCPECYQTFGDDMDNMLRAMHKGTRHVGKVPGRQVSVPVPTSKAERPEPATPAAAPAAPKPPPPPAPVSPKKKLADLKAAIELAVMEERYEDAARLRDEVKAIETKA
ncbi:UvrB/UvrC motif-containing protein [Verrucomicrobium sp. BvORR106]|uniref:UvrB/UvrC motif-containing protein n=1 Tax=Verrucomicrobium sp. BvORR106 TaxID=1403819 RepID=UPI00056EAFEF|nr:UvrB/UvrC motif-containing protein [Verrucomicrobium sp. BvORR106]